MACIAAVLHASMAPHSSGAALCNDGVSERAGAAARTASPPSSALHVSAKSANDSEKRVYASSA